VGTAKDAAADIKWARLWAKVNKGMISQLSYFKYEGLSLDVQRKL
jgi:hypothetical protein